MCTYIYCTHKSSLKWAIHAIQTQTSVAQMMAVLSRFGSTLNTSCCCRILQAFIYYIPKLYHSAHLYDAGWATLILMRSTPLCNVLLLLLYKKKTATLDRNTHETTVYWVITILYVLVIKVPLSSKLITFYGITVNRIGHH